MVIGRYFYYYDDTRGGYKIVKIIQSSTRRLLPSFRNKTQLLRECSKDTKIHIIGFDSKKQNFYCIAVFSKNRYRLQITYYTTHMLWFASQSNFYLNYENLLLSSSNHILDKQSESDLCHS
jgi:hypothetical protein